MRNKLIKLISILIIIFSLIFNDTKNDFYEYLKVFNDYELIYKNQTINEYFLFNKFYDVLPRLTNSFNDTPSSLHQIFNAREIYIFDNKLTPEYIRYIRPINDKYNSYYKNSFFHDKNIIDINLFNKRTDQLDYKLFCNIALNETLLDNKTLDANYKPIISVVVPSYNKKDILLKSIRSIQNQNFKNIEIIIVNDGSTDNSTEIFNYLLETDERIRIFHHIKNMGCFRSRLDGIIYSRGKYIITFDCGDLYEDNYVLLDAYNIIEKYNLDSCKFLFRMIHNFNNFSDNIIPYRLGRRKKVKIIYNSYKIKAFNDKIFPTCGNVWNRLVKSDIYIKGLLLLNELTLNVYKNLWEDIWYNEIINKVSYNFAIIPRVGYVYYNDKKGEGTPIYKTKIQKSKMIREYVAFLYFDYNFCVDRVCKAKIIEKLKYYNEIDTVNQLKNFVTSFEILNDLLEALIIDADVNREDKEYCQKLLYESIIRENKVV